MKKDKNLLGIKRSKRPVNAFTTGQSVEIHFSGVLKEKADLRAGDAVKFTLSEDTLVLSYLGDVHTLSKLGTAKRLRRSGSGVLLAIAEHKLPAIKEYNIPTYIDRIDYIVQDGDILIDLAPYKHKPEEKKPETLQDFTKIVKRVKTFGALAEL